MTDLESAVWGPTMEHDGCLEWLAAGALVLVLLIVWGGMKL